MLYNDIIVVHLYYFGLLLTRVPSFEQNIRRHINSSLYFKDVTKYIVAPCYSSTFYLSLMTDYVIKLFNQVET